MEDFHVSYFKPYLKVPSRGFCKHRGGTSNHTLNCPAGVFANIGGSYPQTPSLPFLCRSPKQRPPLVSVWVLRLKTILVSFAAGFQGITASVSLGFRDSSFPLIHSCKAPNSKTLCLEAPTFKRQSSSLSVRVVG